jgi:hypothetical protein
MQPICLIAAVGTLAVAAVASAMPPHATATPTSVPLSMSFNRPGISSGASASDSGRCLTLTDSSCPSRTGRQLAKLREEALDMQRSDGGRLTPEHRAVLQAKLDAIQKQKPK